MFLFNLSLAEFATILTAVSSFVVLLYLLDRSRKHQKVATLRFWKDSEIPSQRKHRRRIQQPWSLILQLIGIALLLLAIAQLRIGSPDRSSRDHVLLVDASAWMGARAAGGRTLMDEARTAAQRYIRALPSLDRVMLVRADAMATPLTSFESNKSKVEASLRQIHPGGAALNLALGFNFAQQALKMESKRRGEIVYAGPGRLTQDTVAELPPVPEGFRLLPVTANIENAGLKKVGLRRAANDPEVWEVFVTAHNYGTRPRTLPLTVSFGGAPVGTRRLAAAPGADVAANFEFRTKAAGWVEARIEGTDSLEQDNIATLEVPGERGLRVVVYSNEPELLRPLLSANRRVETVFRRPNEYQPDPQAGIVIFDRFRPPSAVSQNAIWIEPPNGASPVPVKAAKQNAQVRWRTDQFLAAGLRSKDVHLENTAVFTSAAGDIPVAEVDGGPVMLARPGKAKLAVFGFHPMRSVLKYELAAPLLFANVLKWMAPEIFLRVEVQAGSIGTVTAPVDATQDPTAIRVESDGKSTLPFTVRDRMLRFFSGAPGTIRAHLGDRELVYSLTLPEVAETKWDVPKTVKTGFANVGGGDGSARDIWQWLAVLGALFLLAEWFLYGRSEEDGAKLIKFPWRPEAQARRKAS